MRVLVFQLKVVAAAVIYHKIAKLSKIWVTLILVYITSILVESTVVLKSIVTWKLTGEVGWYDSITIVVTSQSVIRTCT